MRRTLKENGYSIISFPSGLLSTLSRVGVPSALDFYDETAQYELETSFTLDYMKDQRGVERIVLDTIQNHLPGDCGGTQVDILVETRRGKFPLEDALKFSSNEIKSIIFKDNGKGYDANYLGILKTGKEHNKQAAGQF
ncbi:MAG: hypothetical protein LBO09_04300 [Candidatus Peribacteria bacterium]|jgi:hypothetical protein|nr:hypothetical protein [Candidatus Peribacteria bacterium]